MDIFEEGATPGETSNDSLGTDIFDEDNKQYYVRGHAIFRNGNVPFHEVSVLWVIF